jgi:hypothetical protein
VILFMGEHRLRSSNFTKSPLFLLTIKRGRCSRNPKLLNSLTCESREPFSVFAKGSQNRSRLGNLGGFIILKSHTTQQQQHIVFCNVYGGGGARAVIFKQRPSRGVQLNYITQRTMARLPQLLLPVNFIYTRPTTTDKRRNSSQFMAAPQDLEKQLYDFIVHALR